jgi:hypothetical protein
LAQIISYYVDNFRIKSLEGFAGDQFQLWSPQDLWGLSLVLSAELAATKPIEGAILVDLDETCQRLGISNPVLMRSLGILDGISREDAISLMIAISSIAADSGMH